MNRDLALALEDVATFVRRFVVLSDEQATTIALFVVHTHAFESSETTPYISVTSADKRSGKSRLLDVLRLLVRAALPTANISDAALFRVIAAKKPTLLFDEIDAIFGPRARDREDLRGMLNAGYQHGARIYRMGGANMRTLEEFPVFCPKVFAGIGELPDTIRDRAIRIRLERRTRDEPIDRFIRREAPGQAEPIRESLEHLAAFHADRLAEARPPLPDELDDRAQDVWEPLLAIADLAGGEWPERARAAALLLSTGDSREDESMGARLLQDIYDVFDQNGSERYRTADLIGELAKVEESPWGDWFGKDISPQAIGKLLKPYRIKTMPVWVDGEAHRGYKREQFAEAWLRVLGLQGVRGVRGVRPGSQSQNDLTPPNTPNTLEDEGVRPEPSIHAGSNTPNTPNALTAGRVNGRLLLGDPGYPLQADRAFAAGHITEHELAELLRLHRLCRRATA